MANVKKNRNQMASKADKLQRRLNRKWWSAVLFCLLILFCGFTAATHGWPLQNSLKWFLQAALVAAVVLGLLRVGLPLNYHPQLNVLHSNLGYGTWLTITRAMLIAMLSSYLFDPWPQSRIAPGGLSWAPGTIYIAASILDFMDGMVARACKHETRLGAFLDINIDALGLLIAPLLAVWYGQLPIAYLSVSVAYYLFVIAIRLRKKYSMPVFDLKPYPAARIIAGCQMGLVGIVLLPVLSPPVTTIAAYIFMIPLLAGFLRDWIFVCGYVKSDSALKKQQP
jgi:CDP-diacylglycerol--glycerol-3-phosphate 3-phosphatidyltransferase